MYRVALVTTVVSASSVGAVALVGCLQINEDHCIAKGGDLQCGERMCSMSPNPKEVPDASVDGCVDEMPNDRAYVKYGLPVDFEAFASNLRMYAPQCEAKNVEELRDAYNTLDDDVIGLLDGESRASFCSLDELKERTLAFQEKVDEWIGKCDDELTTTGTDTTDTTDTGSTTDANDSSTTEPTMSCESAEDCAEPTPFCNMESMESMESGMCVSCDGMPNPDAACAAVDATLPVCFAGECVACTPLKPALCDAELLLCDGTSNTCGPCTEHEECASGACDLFVGRCFDPATVVEVGGGGEPTIAEGLAGLEELGPDILRQRRGVLLVHEGADFNETATIDAGSMLEAIAFVAAPGESPEWTYTGAPASPTLTVEMTTTRTYLNGLELQTNTGTNGGWGLSCADGRVDVRRSRIVGNLGGGIEAAGSCELRIENSFVGGDVNDRDAVSVMDAEASVSILYSTLGAGFGAAAALRCVANAGVDVRNSLLVARTSDPEVDCPDPVNSASEGGVNTSWFTDYAAGDYHLTVMAPAGIRVADWEPGDPPTDIDGEDRVTADGEPDHAGADVP
jgi:hypothetical protein